MLCLGSPPASNSSSVSTQTSQASSSARTQQKFDVGLIHAMLSASETDGALKKAIASRTYELKGTEAALHEVCYKLYMSRVVRKLAFCICENKDADQLRS